jgi:hypothetical protein
VLLQLTYVAVDLLLLLPQILNHLLQPQLLLRQLIVFFDLFTFVGGLGDVLLLLVVVGLGALHIVRTSPANLVFLLLSDQPYTLKYIRDIVDPALLH